MHIVHIGWRNIQRAFTRRKNVLISRKKTRGAAINAVQCVCSRKENILAILVAGANRRKKQVNCVK